VCGKNPEEKECNPRGWWLSSIKASDVDAIPVEYLNDGQLPPG